MNSAIIVAAGSGSRMASDRPKQFLLLAGIPLIFHTLRPFEQCDSIDETIVVLPPESAAEFLDSAAKFGVKKVTRVVPGGATRAESVKRGLTAIRAASAEIVAVHDGVRPFVTDAILRQTLSHAVRYGAAITAVPVQDTLKRVSEAGDVEATVARDRLWRVQTPQAFQRSLLQAAFLHAWDQGILATDEAALLESLGKVVKVVRGIESNIKVTTPDDLLFAENVICTLR